MSVSHWGRLVVTTLCLGLISSGLTDAAHADKDQRNVIAPAAKEGPTEGPPAAVAPAVVGLPEAVDRLQQSQQLAALPVDWAGLKTFYVSEGPALWVTPTGYSALGSLLIRQVPKAAAAGMTVSAEVQALMAALPPQVPSEQAADTEVLMSALYITGAYDVTNAPGVPVNPGAGLLTNLRSAKDQARVVATQYPSFHMFWRLHAALPTYIGYYERGGWPTVSGSEKIEPGDKGPRVKQVAERLLATGELPVLGADPELYDPALEVAVQGFQKSHGLNNDGVIGKRTIEEMNVSAEQRVKMLLLNLDRIPHDRAGFGSTVHLRDANGDTIVYQLVMPEDSDFEKGMISTSSPIGKGILNKEEGDEVKVTTPNGVRKFEIVKIITIHDDDGGS